MLDSLKDLIYAAGIREFGVISPADIEYRQVIRDICADDSCRQYGKTRACPPAVGTVEACRERCLKYETMLVFTGPFVLEDSYDFEGMKRSMTEFKDIAERSDNALKPHLGDYIVLSNESCNKCPQCTYPDAPCRFPDKPHHSVEGYGILVSELAQKTGVKYNNGAGTVTFFGAMLFNQALG